MTSSNDGRDGDTTTTVVSYIFRDEENDDREEDERSIRSPLPDHPENPLLSNEGRMIARRVLWQIFMAHHHQQQQQQRQSDIRPNHHHHHWRLNQPAHDLSYQDAYVRLLEDILVNFFFLAASNYEEFVPRWILSTSLLPMDNTVVSSLSPESNPLQNLRILRALNHHHQPSPRPDPPAHETNTACSSTVTPPPRPDPPGLSASTVLRPQREEDIGVLPATTTIDIEQEDLYLRPATTKASITKSSSYVPTMVCVKECNSKHKDVDDKTAISAATTFVVPSTNEDLETAITASLASEDQDRSLNDDETTPSIALATMAFESLSESQHHHHRVPEVAALAEVVPHHQEEEVESRQQEELRDLRSMLHQVLENQEQLQQQLLLTRRPQQQRASWANPRIVLRTALQVALLFSSRRGD